MTELATPVGDIARRRLRSASSTDLVVPATRRSTIGDRAFAVAGPEHGTVYLLLSAPLPHTTPSKMTLNLTFLNYPIHCDIVYFDYVQHSCIVVYTAYCALQIVRLTGVRGVPVHITLPYPHFSGRKGEELAVTCCQQKRSAD